MFVINDDMYVDIKCIKYNYIFYDPILMISIII